MIDRITFDQIIFNDRRCGHTAHCRWLVSIFVEFIVQLLIELDVVGHIVDLVV